MEKTSKQILSADSIREIKRLKTVYPEKKSAILMILHVIHRQFGFIEKTALVEAAEIMELPIIDFEQSASFYTYFPSGKTGKYHIQVCRTLSCYLRGAEEVKTYLKELLKIKNNETTEDGLFSLTEVECLGSCGTAPVIQINDDYYENLTRERVDEIINDLRNKSKNG